MATFLYECKDHGEFELEHSINDKIEFCPKCKEAGNDPLPLKRLISGGTGFILKGGSWASQGYS